MEFEIAYYWWKLDENAGNNKIWENLMNGHFATPCKPIPVKASLNV